LIVVLVLLQLNQIGCTVTFADPYALAAFHAFLLCKMDVRRTKNKFLPPMGPLLGPGEMVGDGAPRERSEYQDVLVNILWLVERISHAVEVQLALHDLDQIRYFSHKPYKVCRMQGYMELVNQPVFTAKRRDR
jgi:hypothetical protein